MYKFGKSSVKPPASSPVSVSTSQALVSPTQPPVKITANWKAYSNEKYKISFDEFKQILSTFRFFP